MKNNALLETIVTTANKVKINLRALEPEDLELLYGWENNPATWQVSNNLAPFSRYILRQYIENAHLDIFQTRQLRFIIETESNALECRPIGTIDLFEYDPFHNRAGIGILIASEADRNKGYGSQALSELIRYSFGTLCLHQLYCHISVDNCQSIELFRKAGFTECGLRKEWLKTENGWKDEMILQLLNNPGIG